MAGVIKVKDAMVKKIITIGESVNIQTAARAMTENRVGSLVVMRGKNPVGILTESDIIKKVVRRDLSAANAHVKEIMSHPLKYVGPDEDLGSVAKKMIANKIRRIIVMKRGELLGIITHTDIVRASPGMADVIGERLRMREGERPILQEDNTGTCESCGNISDDLQQAGDEWLCDECRERLGEEK
ncbi:MAG: CBS domain-containing protein [Candidatus Aenigmatarchaeota archaeon]